MVQKIIESCRLEKSYDSVIGLPKDESTKDNITNCNVKDRNCLKEEIPPLTTFDIKRNIALLSISLLLMYTSIHSAGYLQSTMHEKDGAGVLGLASSSITAVLLYLVLPSITISRLGYKWTIVICSLCHIPFAITNYFDRISVILIGNVILGIAQAPLWVAKASYFTQICVWYAKLTEQTTIVVLNRYMGIFYMTFNSSKIWGTILLSLIIPRNNIPYARDVGEILQCVNNENQTSANSYVIGRVSNTQVGMLCATWAILLVISVLSFLLLDDIKTDVSRDTDTLKSLLGTIRHLIESTPQKLLVPINLFSGMSMSFFTVDFTRSFIGCVLGIGDIGYVSLFYGISNTFSCVILGQAVKYVGQIACLSFAYLASGINLLLLIVWKPDSEEQYMLYISATLSGLSDSGIKTQIIAFSGSIFQEDKEAAFSTRYLFETTGYMMSYLFSLYFLTTTKLYILLSVLLLGATGYFIVEYMQRNIFKK